VKPKQILVGLVAVVATGGLAPAQDAPVTLQAGPATVAPHWTKNTGYPTSIPEGDAYYIVVRGDTLWDLAARFMKNPYLWPQIWDGNKHVTDAHWIYPGDPLILPKLAVIAEQAGLPPPPGTEAEGETEEATGSEAERAIGAGLGPAAGEATALAPITEEITLRCSEYLADRSENDDLRIIGSEEGSDRNIFGEGDIVYLNGGIKAGLKAGDVYTVHHAIRPVTHPTTGRGLGTKIATQGWLRLILVQENSATAVIEHSCDAVELGAYLSPYEPLSVPVVARHEPPDRLTPPTGKLIRHIVDIEDDLGMAGAGHFVTIDAGSQDGITPGSIFTAFRVVYPDVPTARQVLGELIVVATREKTATAKVMQSRAEITKGDGVELQ
jgi:hypothetical protein